MLRYDRQTKPGLVALYDIRPGNGAGPFLQPGACLGHSVERDRFRKVGINPT